MEQMQFLVAEARDRDAGKRFYTSWWNRPYGGRPTPYKFVQFVAISPVHNMHVKINWDGELGIRCERDRQWSSPYQNNYFRAELHPMWLEKFEPLFAFIDKHNNKKLDTAQLDELSELLLVLPSYPGEFYW